MKPISKVKQKQAYCNTCNRPTLHVWHDPSPEDYYIKQQAILILLTCGLWFPFFIIWSILQGRDQRQNKFHCQDCGSTEGAPAPQIVACPHCGGHLQKHGKEGDCPLCGGPVIMPSATINLPPVTKSKIHPGVIAFCIVGVVLMFGFLGSLREDDKHEPMSAPPPPQVIRRLSTDDDPAPPREPDVGKLVFNVIKQREEIKERAAINSYRTYSVKFSYHGPHNVEVGPLEDGWQEVKGSYYRQLFIDHRTMGLKEFDFEATVSRSSVGSLIVEEYSIK